jgi:hypothetical protein
LDSRNNVSVAVLVLQVKSVSQGRHRGVSPATATIYRNMLIQVQGGVVHTIDISDIVARGQIALLQVSVRKRRFDHLANKSRVLETEFVSIVGKDRGQKYEKHNKLVEHSK